MKAPLAHLYDGLLTPAECAELVASCLARDDWQPVDSVSSVGILDRVPFPPAARARLAGQRWRTDTSGRVLLYEEGDGLESHRDRAPYNARRIVVLLQAAAEGGALEVDDFALPLALGGGAVFNTNYPHGVTEVTRGRRLALIAEARRLPAPTTCEDCGDASPRNPRTLRSRRRVRCCHCHQLVCGWCWGHVHGHEPSHTAAECRDRRTP